MTDNKRAGINVLPSGCDLFLFARAVLRTEIHTPGDHLSVAEHLTVQEHLDVVGTTGTLIVSKHDRESQTMILVPIDIEERQNKMTARAFRPRLINWLSL